MGTLYRHFLRTFFKSEGLAEGGDPRSMVIALGGTAASIAVMVCFGFVAMAGHVDISPLIGFFLALSMAMTAMVATLEWDTLFPGALDFAVLRPLPLAAGVLFAAKLAALMTLVAGFAVLTNMFSATLLPVFGAPASNTWRQTLALIGAQIAATAAGSAWAFFAVMALCGLLLAVGGERGLRRLGPLLQFLLFTASLTTLVLCWYLMSPPCSIAWPHRAGRAGTRSSGLSDWTSGLPAFPFRTRIAWRGWASRPGWEPRSLPWRCFCWPTSGGCARAWLPTAGLDHGFTVSPGGGRRPPRLARPCWVLRCGRSCAAGVISCTYPAGSRVAAPWC